MDNWISLVPLFPPLYLRFLNNPLYSTTTNGDITVKAV